MGLEAQKSTAEATEQAKPAGPAAPNDAATPTSPISFLSPLWALAGAVWALTIVTSIGQRIHWVYRPYRGVVGLPAYQNNASTDEKFYYWAGMFAAATLGWAAMTLGRRMRRGATAMGAALTLAGGLAFAFVLRAGHGSAWTALKTLLHNPGRLGLLAALGACLAGYVAMRSRPEPPGESSPLGAFVLLAIVNVTCFRVLSIPINFALGAAILASLTLYYWAGDQNGWNGLATAPGEARPHWGASAAWWLMALSPIWLVAARLRAGAHTEPPPSWTQYAALAWWGATALAGALAAFHRSKRPVPALQWILPFAVWGLLITGIPAFYHYDAFHQGEITYPALALSAGKIPWLDVFFVHGFGADTLPGLIAGIPQLGQPVFRAAELVVLAMVNAVMAALAVTVMLAMWGRRWWALAVTAALIPINLAGWPIGRYILVWAVAGLAFGYAQTGRRRWLAAGGAVTVAALFHSLDTGASALAAIVIWTAWLAWLERDWRPGAALAGGMAVPAIPLLILFTTRGMLGEMWTMHLEYLRMKPHYDKIPLVLNSLAPLLAVAAPVMGLWDWRRSSRKKEGPDPLEKMIPFFTLIAMASLTRMLDRSDTGHLAYASALIWPLFGSLAIVYAGRRYTRAKLILLTAAMFLARFFFLPFDQKLEPGRVPVCNECFEAAQMAGQPYFQPSDVPEALAFLDVAGGLIRALKPGETFYDFSNQPGLYSWTRHLSPTRFFTAFYAAGEEWQTEVVEALESTRPTWTIWRGSNPSASRIDGLPSWMRQWRIAEYILANYRPAGLIRTPSTDIYPALRPIEKWGGVRPLDAIILQRAEPGAAPPPRAFEQTIQLWWPSEPLGNLPRVWGEFPQGAPPVPPRPLGGQTIGASDNWVPVTLPENADSTVREMQVVFEKPFDGNYMLRWIPQKRPEMTGQTTFTVSADFAGPYRVTLSNQAAWVWGGPFAGAAVCAQGFERNGAPPVGSGARITWFGGKSAR